MKITRRPNNLRHYRLKRHLTQQGVLKALGHSSASRLSAWENGEAVPSLKHLIILSELYQISIEKLLGTIVKKVKRGILIERIEKEDFKHNAAQEKTTDELLNEFAEILMQAYLHEKQENLLLD